MKGLKSQTPERNVHLFERARTALHPSRKAFHSNSYSEEVVPRVPRFTIITRCSSLLHFGSKQESGNASFSSTKHNLVFSREFIQIYGSSLWPLHFSIENWKSCWKRDTGRGRVILLVNWIFQCSWVFTEMLKQNWFRPEPRRTFNRGNG